MSSTAVGRFHQRHLNICACGTYAGQAVYRIQYTVNSIDNTMYSIPYTAYIMQYAVYCIQYILYRYVTYSGQAVYMPCTQCAPGRALLSDCDPMSTGRRQ